MQAGRPLVRFADIPLDWTDFRLTLRQTADILQRFEALERADYDRILAIVAAFAIVDIGAFPDPVKPAVEVDPRSVAAQPGISYFCNSFDICHGFTTTAGIF